MTEKDIGKALLDLSLNEETAAQRPEELTRKILKRDRRRIRNLAVLATLSWCAAAGGFGWLLIYYLLYVLPRLNAYAAGSAQLGTDWRDWAAAGKAAAELSLVNTAVLLLAALCTIALTAASRRATLRQINANLVEISAQLKSLRSNSNATGRAQG